MKLYPRLCVPFIIVSSMTLGDPEVAQYMKCLQVLSPHSRGNGVVFPQDESIGIVFPGNPSTQVFMPNGSGFRLNTSQQSCESHVDAEAKNLLKEEILERAKSMIRFRKQMEDLKNENIRRYPGHKEAIAKDGRNYNLEGSIESKKDVDFCISLKLPGSVKIRAPLAPSDYNQEIAEVPLTSELEKIAIGFAEVHAEDLDIGVRKKGAHQGPLRKIAPPEKN